MRLGIDIDGVLARFEDRYAEILTAQTGMTFPVGSPDWPSTWYWERDAGITKKQENAAWETIKTSDFWNTLPEMKGARQALKELSRLSDLGHDVYFVTSRPGHYAKFWTENWLMKHGMGNPTVLIAVAHKKGQLAVGLDLNIFIDDKPENCNDVIMASPNTKVYLIDAPYNKWAEKHLDFGIRIDSVMGVLFLEGLTQEKVAA